MEAIRNKVDESGLVTLDLSELIPEGERVLLDIKPWLFEELLLKEQEFRERIKTHDWNFYSGKFVALTCSSDAIIPVWAWMLIEVALQPYAEEVVFGGLDRLEEQLLLDRISHFEVEEYRNARVVIKGCGDTFVPPPAYAAITAKITPLVKSIMYGEPCSTVPVMKRK
jgi:hypothetical protein